MRFAFTDEQRAFQGTVRELLKKECPPDEVRRSWGTDSGRSSARWQKLADLGVLGLTVPEARGGLGLRELDLVLLLEESGRAALPEPIVETTAVAVPLLSELDCGERGARWLEAVAAGQAMLSVGLDGMPFITDAHVAEPLLLQRGDELHALAKGAYTMSPQPSVDGARRLFKVSFEPSSGTRIAGGAAAIPAMARAFDRGALGVSAQLLGLAAQLIETTVEYVKVRQQFGQAIGSFQAVKHHLTNALLQLEFARPAVYRAAHSMAHASAESSLHVSIGKSLAGEAAAEAAKVALQCHGAIGYSFECDLHLWMKRAWALGAAFGDGAFHRARVGAAILDRASNANA